MVCMILVPFWSPNASHSTCHEREGLRSKRHLLQMDRALRSTRGMTLSLWQASTAGTISPFK